jgi:hypothetical protein
LSSKCFFEARTRSACTPSQQITSKFQIPNTEIRHEVRLK